jgi:hypothetical protein
MSRVSLFRVPATAIFAIYATVVSPLVFGKCCPGTGHGEPKATSGLGESFPATVDLAADPSWQVYEFEKGGIQYVQVNDQNGAVRAAVGRIEDTFWVLPLGSDAERVLVTNDRVPKGLQKVLYRSEEVEVVLYQDGSQQRWVIRPSVFTH